MRMEVYILREGVIAKLNTYYGVHICLFITLYLHAHPIAFCHCLNMTVSEFSLANMMVNKNK